VTRLFFDKSSTFWIGTKGAGIAVFSPYKYKFKHITQEPFKTTWLTNKYILSLKKMPIIISGLALTVVDFLNMI
jgi:hypothetical protein